jgi:hypothetical protein
MDIFENPFRVANPERVKPNIFSTQQPPINQSPNATKEKPWKKCVLMASQIPFHQQPV